MDKKAKKRSLGLSKTEKRIVICTAAVVLIALSIYPTVTYLVPFIKYSHAVSLMEKGSFDEAAAAFEEMGDYKDAPEKIWKCWELKAQARLEAAYQDAVALRENKEYDEAISAFTKLGNYRDSTIQISETKYQKALDLKESEEYDEALSIFNEISDYSDSDEQIKEIEFTQAQNFFDDEKYEEASYLFLKLNDYKNAQDMWKESTYRQAFQIASIYKNIENDIENGREVSSIYYSYTDSVHSLLESIKGYKNVDEWLDKFFLLKTSEKIDGKNIEFSYKCFSEGFKIGSDERFKYIYNKDGTLVEKDAHTGAKFEYSYEDGGIVHERVMSPYTGKITGDNYYKYEYNSNGQVIKITQTNIRNTNYFTYKYDKNGNIIEETEVLELDDYKTIYTYKYDTDGHIIEKIYDKTGEYPVYETTTYDYSDPTYGYYTTSEKGSLTKETGSIHYSWVWLFKDTPEAEE